MSDRDTNTHALDPRTLAIRELNNRLRHTWTGGRVFLTQGVEALGPYFMLRALRLVRDFDAFLPDNDPFEEHDFGAVTAFRAKLFWKIEYYDPDLVHGSSDPAVEEMTCRVLTIMLASEW